MTEVERPVSLPETTRSEPARNRRRWPVLVALIIGAVVLAGVGAGVTLWLGADPDPPASSGTFDVAGDMVLPDGGFGWGSHETSCTGSDGYNDIGPGKVVVADVNGRTLAIGELSTSTVSKGVDGRLIGCSLSFLVREVPAGEKFYRVSVGRRGHLEFTQAQLRNRIRLTLT